MIKIEYISDENSETHLIETKRNGSQYELYLDGNLHGSTGDYTQLLDEIRGLAGDLAKNMFDAA